MNNTIPELGRCVNVKTEYSDFQLIFNRIHFKDKISNVQTDELSDKISTNILSPHLRLFFEILDVLSPERKRGKGTCRLLSAHSSEPASVMERRRVMAHDIMGNSYL